MHSKASFVLALGIMALAGWAVAVAQGWAWKAALFPLVIGIPVFCLAAAEALWVILGKTGSGETPDLQLSRDLPARVARRRSLLAIAWMLGFFAAIVLLGFPVAVPLFVLLYLKIQGRERWGLVLVYAVAVWGLFYALFDRLLHLPFPAGWIQTWIGLN